MTGDRKKYAVLTMDIEDWYHLDYFSGKDTDRSFSMLDGFFNFMAMLDKHSVKATFFVLSELAGRIGEGIRCAAENGHEIGCHGKSHIRPTQINRDVFFTEIADAKARLSELAGREVYGYRAPCYSIDRERYDAVIDAGFKYSSSKIAFGSHPLYGKLDMAGFEQPVRSVYRKEGFYEFELSTSKCFGYHVPVSGGGYIRIVPWMIMRPMISRYLKNSDVYVLYIHPFELSGKSMPDVRGVSFLTGIRARRGLGKVSGRIEQLIAMLKRNRFEITTFAGLIDLVENMEASMHGYGMEMIKNGH